SPSPVVQRAVAQLLRDGHYLRHLRRMKRLYAARHDALRARLAGRAGVETIAGLHLLLRLPPGTDDEAIGQAARAAELAPGILSRWYATDAARTPGLLLCVTNLSDAVLAPACAQLDALLEARLPDRPRLSARGRGGRRVRGRGRGSAGRGGAGGRARQSNSRS
ncbi:MAG TPA: hypothetical protein VFT22_03620, partial [Kofleriaceae bacterium]|nr:hypothetical protein [Kofleriaceae bacterium]